MPFGIRGVWGSRHFYGQAHHVRHNGTISNRLHCSGYRPYRPYRSWFSSYRPITYIPSPIIYRPSPVVVSTPSVALTNRNIQPINLAQRILGVATIVAGLAMVIAGAVATAPITGVIVAGAITMAFGAVICADSY